MSAGDAYPGAPPLALIAREWGRIGITGFGGPPAHVALLRELCVRRARWLSEEEFEHAIAATNVLPGPASTQLAIYCAWRVRGRPGALLGGVCFIAPGLVIVLALSALFLAGSPPAWLRGAGRGAGAAVAAVAVRAGLDVAVPLHRRAAPSRRPRMLAYSLAGAAAAATLGPSLVLVIVGCGAIELLLLRPRLRTAVPSLVVMLLGSAAAHPARALAARVAHAAAIRAHEPGGLGALAWSALKVGALSFGGGFVIIPLMQADAVSTYHWMTHGQFVNAVALGQVTPGPVVQTVAAVGYSASGLLGGVLAALVAFGPSFGFVLLGAGSFERLRADTRAQTFLAGAAPAAAGAILGSAIPLGGSLSTAWQYAVLAAAAVSLLIFRRGVVATLLAAGAAGTAAVLLGAPVPS